MLALLLFRLEAAVFLIEELIVDMGEITRLPEVGLVAAALLFYFGNSGVKVIGLGLFVNLVVPLQTSGSLVQLVASFQSRKLFLLSNLYPMAHKLCLYLVQTLSIVFGVTPHLNRSFLVHPFLTV